MWGEIMQELFGLAVLFVVSVVSWIFVFNRSVRLRHSRTAADFFRMNREQKEMFDSLNLAAALILALTFTVLFLCFLVGSMVGLMRTK